MSKKIIITGGVASGKSTIIEYLKSLNTDYDFFSFDDYTRECYTHEDVKEFLMSNFGSIDRSYISDIVFSNPQKRKLLDEFFVPKVIAALSILLASDKKIVMEMPLFHKLWYSRKKSIAPMWTSNITIVTTGCSDEIRADRIMKRNGFSHDKAWAIINSQPSLSVQLMFTNLYIDTAIEIPYNVLYNLMQD